MAFDANKFILLGSFSCAHQAVSAGQGPWPSVRCLDHRRYRLAPDSLLWASSPAVLSVIHLLFLQTLAVVIGGGGGVFCFDQLYSSMEKRNSILCGRRLCNTR